MVSCPRRNVEFGHIMSRILSVAAAGAVIAGSALAEPGDTVRGERIYAERCVWCHGADGDGLGPSAERLNPPPRDFTMAQYKIKTTGFDDFVPNDDDLFRMIGDGMPGTSMPQWSDTLSEQERWDLVAYIKAFGGLDEEQPSQQVDYGAQVATSSESIEKGKSLFRDRCSECHGEEGKGDGVKRLKDDEGNRTWPRNLTKPWTFRASNDPKDVFARISVGIPGTQMPSFADPKSKKKLSNEERWHVANYVASLTETEKVARPENTVVKAEQIEGDVPDSADDARWKRSEPTTFILVPQIVAKERLFTPSIDAITVRALYNEREIALLLEWDDRTKSIPGDPRAEKISDPDIAEDAVAVQFPVEISEGMEKPYFGMGDASHPVDIWHWKSGAADEPQSVRLLNGTGFENIEERDAAAAGLRATGIYRHGTWSVVMARPLSTADPVNDVQFGQGTYIPIAFAAWDGSNSEKGSRHTMTTWYWLLLKPAAGFMPYLAALAVIGLVAGGQFWWVRSAAPKKPAPEVG